MKKKSKFFVGMCMLSLLFLLAGRKEVVIGTTYADTATGLTMTGTLLEYEAAQKNLISDAFNATYERVSTLFEKSGLTLMQSLNYKSLVCLGVMNQNDSMLMAMQRDKQQLKLGFLKDFLQIESDIATLEEKARIMKEKNISLFEQGTNYESEQAKILSRIESTVALHSGLIKNFEMTYINKIAKFGQDIIDYSLQNSGVVGYVNDKLFRLGDIDTKFGTLSKQIDQINALLIGSGASFVQSFSGVRSSFVNLLDLNVQALIDANVKKYKVLKDLSGVLASEKSFALRMYGLDFDEKLNTILDQWYNKTDYDFIQTQMGTIDTNFKVDKQLNCSKAFTDSQGLDGLIATITNKMSSMMASVNSGLSLATTNNSLENMKIQLLNQFNNFNNSNLTKKLKEFDTLIKDKIKILLDQQRNGATNASVGSSSTISVPVKVQIPIVFSSAMKKNQKGSIVKTLQELLKNNGYYTGPINSSNTKQTIEGVYQFQIKNGLLKGYEKKQATRGWMGPSTREKLNDLINNGGLLPKTVMPTTGMIQTTGAVIIVNSGVVQISTGTTNTNNTKPTTGTSTNTNDFYQTMINDLIGNKTTTGDIQGVLQTAMATMTKSMATSSSGQKIFLQGFQSAIQNYLNNLQ